MNTMPGPFDAPVPGTRYQFITVPGIAIICDGVNPVDDMMTLTVYMTDHNPEECHGLESDESLGECVGEITLMPATMGAVYSVAEGTARLLAAERAKLN